MNPSHITVLTALVITACRVAVAAEGIEPVAIETRLFLSHSGKFSEPISETSELWNTPATSDGSNRPSRNTFVRVQVNGPAGGAALKGRVDLTVATVGSSQPQPECINDWEFSALKGSSSSGFGYPILGARHSICLRRQIPLSRSSLSQFLSNAGSSSSDA